jgi:hypothetical protein
MIEVADCPHHQLQLHLRRRAEVYEECDDRSEVSVTYRCRSRRLRCRSRTVRRRGSATPRRQNAIVQHSSHRLVAARSGSADQCRPIGPANQKHSLQGRVFGASPSCNRYDGSADLPSIREMTACSIGPR